MPRFQRNRASITALALTATVLLTGCASTTPSETGDSASGPALVAESPDRQWTGVAWIGSSGDVIVNYPRWTDEYTNAVERVRIGDDGSVTRVPWPNQAMNTVPNPESLSPSERRDVLVAVQAVHTDRKGRIWILDTGNPGFAGVLEDGAKLIMVNPSTGRVERTYAFDSSIAKENSYLNDVRIDIRYERAYITDSGIGGLVVVDLDTAEARRVLDGHPSTLAEPDFTPVIGGRAFVDPQTGQPPQIHADGVALSPDGRHLYWQALTAKTLYRLPTRSGGLLRRERRADRGDREHGPHRRDRRHGLRRSRQPVLQRARERRRDVPDPDRRHPHAVVVPATRVARHLQLRRGPRCAVRVDGADPPDARSGGARHALAAVRAVPHFPVRSVGRELRSRAARITCVDCRCAP
ncbi:MAG: L-dopachrome tautomerase-related protein [Phycisphaerales bacterium]